MFSKSQEQELHFIRIIQEPNSEKLMPVSLYPCFSVSLHLCIPVSLYLFILLSLYPNISVPLYPLSMGVKYFPEGIFLRATFQVTISQMYNFPKVSLGPLGAAGCNGGPSAETRVG